MSSVDENENNTAVEKTKSLSMFLQKVAYNAQLFVNFYILKHPKSLPNGLLKQNFWYSVCRVVYQNLSVQNFQSHYPPTPHLAEVWDELNGVEGVNLTVDKENFENIIANYFIYMIRQAFHIKNRLPAFTVTKATLNNAPFSIMSVLKHILEKYEFLIVEAPLPVPVSQLQIIPQEQSDETDQTNKRPREKKKVLKNNNDNNGVKRDFQPPRLFSLFPNPGSLWCFVKLDSQDLTGVFPTASMERISFCRKRYAESPVNEIALELQDFNSEEIDRYFRPCTVDPNRKDAFVSFYGNTDARRLSSAYDNMNISTNRLKLEQDRKKEQGVQTIETNIPSVKSAGADKYITHVKYMMQHQGTLFNFYNFQTARVKWCNYIGKQRALQDAVNILINESKKYN
ncbi:uncharacterized protein EV154DRAFT_557220 [Mucor mucedo]|uniref:uncharacterized protein n=1 Tax=Mucor mucedo TaxID=29922 RepID=UPI0022208A14|nr:uncharacterized protein EV154DRAFT_557220 [Mucor mucedo]KAI7865456.1 hypothetical protein EV154DRAFT_557220 [Mucor mucedo]